VPRSVSQAAVPEGESLSSAAEALAGDLYLRTHPKLRSLAFDEMAIAGTCAKPILRVC